jgi:hypothetical protein
MQHSVLKSIQQFVAAAKELTQGFTGHTVWSFCDVITLQHNLAKSFDTTSSSVSLDRQLKIRVALSLAVC